MQPDFSHLYRAIGVRPDCSLDAFRHAFRRHVAGRHPDRADDAAPGDDAPPLSEINALYAMAMRFHRRHGRLPGAALAANGAEAIAVADSDGAGGRASMRSGTARNDELGSGVPRAALDPAPAGARRWTPWLVVAALLVVAIGVWQAPTHSRRAAVAAAAAHPETQTDAPPMRLALGMRADAVRAIQGEPLRVRDDEWDYGPSWLRFERGRLVDWYSSPLNRLKTATASPQADMTEPVDPASTR
jgi:hypothetical protein